MVLEEVRQFRKIDKHDLSAAGGDEHIGRAMIRGFLDAQFRARLVLAYVGDETAIEELVKEFDLRQSDRRAWIETRHTKDCGVYPSGRKRCWIWRGQLIHLTQ